ncbi:immunity 70 family protein [Listeria costaricensis]|uniref:immunity 70 family protein n=1 Tax=Listeria costaricensis TaxID=2026604 RepID=UPI001F08EC14|nr:immunity 70 family protein [Listeria costaricensis]
MRIVAVGIKVDFLWYSIGTGDFLHSFFSTICINLENGKWGSNYPVIMTKLYSGLLTTEDQNEAKKELAEIQKELSQLLPEKVVWDAEDLSTTPPWGNQISEDVTSLANYYITSDRKDLISVMMEAIDEAIDESVNLEIKSL